MSDSFADLWNSSGKPAAVPQKLGALSANPSPSLNTKRPQNDVFSMLAAASPSSTPHTRSVTPSYAGTPSFSKPSTPQPSIQKTPSSGPDAFSNLLSGTIANSPSNANMTIAERAALVERQRTEQILRQQSAVQKSVSAWDGLDSLARAPSSGAASSKLQATNSTAEDWGLAFEAPKPKPKPTPVPKPVASSTPALDHDDWGLSDFASQPPSTNPPTTSTTKSSGSIWDLDEFDRPSPPKDDKPVMSRRSRSPGDFDFGGREDGLLNDQSDDDILGDLSRPVGEARRPSPTPSPQPPTSGQRSRAVSPPPHIIGQIVEMGFSPQQARVALAATDSGLDVQAALEMLLSNGAGSSTPREEPQRQRRPDGDREADEIPPRRRQNPRLDADIRDTPSPGDTQRNLQEHADKLIAQASEIGSSLFSRANALWKESKVKVQKAYEEHTGATGSAPPGPSRNGRPRWMEDAIEREQSGDAEWPDHSGGSGFKDEHTDDVLPPKPSNQERRKPDAKQRPQVQQRPPPEQASSSPRTANLLSDDTPKAYVSPFRRKTPSRTQTQATPPPSNVPKHRTPSPLTLEIIRTVSASASQIVSSSKHKESGTEKYKLGQYAEAEASYSKAIAALPDSHLLLVPLHNNRALTRIKIGDHSGAIEDCTTVITRIGASYHPARVAKVTKEDEGASVDLADGLIKALRRRAEAYEGKEKWESARQDWESIAAKDFAGKVRGDAVTGVGRCRRMLTSDQAPTTSKPSTPAAALPRPKPKPKPVQRGPTPPSEALDRVRAANQAAEAEDQAKHDLKDTVDGRLVAWKGGKETNIRALIASLETVLWPELGWQKVGMHELVTPSQVKIRYTKAIAKLHPDKLNANNTTVEQRMIANGVFGALNEAWNAFKQ